jgi:phosphoribosylglycinamide formyltransferase-1
VDEELDHGVIVTQRVVEVRDEDSAETLAARILAQEHIAYTEAIRSVLSGEYGVQGRRYAQVPGLPIESRK